ncbi:helix-turn-helix protein [Alteromonadaceae bacterium 2753L.S.0a.02]|nr:helix-turn-helix protein [Alteromonadaceae bacterium 2753L.S.0a.02]
MLFGEKISEICQREGINLKEFSKLTGIGYSTLQAFKANKKTPRMQTLEKITSNPRFTQYTNFLMGSDELPDEEAEFLSLFKQVCDAGQGEEALKYLKYLAEREGK